MSIKIKTITLSLTSLLAALSLTGCSRMLAGTMPSSSVSMKSIYTRAIDGSNSQDDLFKNTRAKLPRIRQQLEITQQSKNQLGRQFQRLPNPNITMYVYPHFVGSGSNLVPVPGYSTEFPLYQHVYYEISK